MGNLVLKRREGEEIVVNERMRIRVVKVKGGSCKLAIDAPHTDVIRRGELPYFGQPVSNATTFGMAIAK